MVRARVATSLLGFAVLGLLGSLTGCGSATMSRIDSNRAEYESWPLDIQEAVLHQQVVKGMSPTMVRMAIGEPTSVEHRVGKQGENEEVWIYRVVDEPPPPLDPMSPSAAIHGISAIPSPATPRHTDQDEITFVDGAVTLADIAVKP
jgi:hypothetical protein